MNSRMNRPADLRRHFQKRFELAIVLALALTIFAFQVAHGLFYKVQDPPKQLNLEIEVTEIPQTEQLHRPPPPPRPAVAVAVESEDVPEDVTIASTELNLDVLPPPPPPQVEDADVDENFIFVAYDEAPVMIGGPSALLKELIYPELARKAGVEGTVMIGALVDVDGQVKKTVVLKDSGVNVGFEDAAMQAVMKTRWKPAQQRDRVVKVWMAIPVKFKLKGPERTS